MPRPNPLRGLRSEANLARRIAYEREQRQWTYEGTAKRLSDAGCPIQASAIYKIEKGRPARRISVDELVAFARVFGLDLDELLLPIEAVHDREARVILKAMSEAEAALVKAVDGVLASMFLYLALPVDRPSRSRLHDLMDNPDSHHGYVLAHGSVPPNEASPASRAMSDAYTALVLAAMDRALEMYEDGPRGESR